MKLSSDPAANLSPGSAESPPLLDMKVLAGQVNGIPALIGEVSIGKALPIRGAWSLTFPEGKVVMANRVWMLIQFSIGKSTES